MRQSNCIHSRRADGPRREVTGDDSLLETPSGWSSGRILRQTAMPGRAEALDRIRARGIELARPKARGAPGPKGGGQPTPHSASPARAGDYVWVVPDEPATHGSLVALCHLGRRGKTVVRLLISPPP